MMIICNNNNLLGVHLIQKKKKMNVNDLIWSENIHRPWSSVVYKKIIARLILARVNRGIECILKYVHANKWGFFVHAANLSCMIANAFLCSWLCDRIEPQSNRKKKKVKRNTQRHKHTQKKRERVSEGGTARDIQGWNKLTRNNVEVVKQWWQGRCVNIQNVRWSACSCDSNFNAL